MRRRSPSPVCTGNVSRVRSRFESGGSTISSQPRVTPATSVTNQTLPKTFKLRETLNPAESRFKPTSGHVGNRFGGSNNHLNDSSAKTRLTGSARTVNSREPFPNTSPPPPRSKALLERQISVPDRPSPPPRFVPARQMSHDLIQVKLGLLTHSPNF